MAAFLVVTYLSLFARALWILCSDKTRFYFLLLGFTTLLESLVRNPASLTMFLL